MDGDMSLQAPLTRCHLSRWERELTSRDVKATHHID
jgi:hypothetical protein